jgi:transmembrane sensor
MDPRKNSADIEATAAAWFAKREGDDWSAVDQAQLETWLDSSTAHRIAFIRIAAAWESAARLSALGAGVPAGTIPPRDAWGFARPRSETTSRVLRQPGESVNDPELDVASSSANTPDVHHSVPPRFLRRTRAIAALLVVAAAAGTVWYFSMDRSNSYRTQIGAVTTVPLADGSKVTLNTDSQIHVELGPTARRIKLDKGEAFFDVAKDAARPFIVEISDKRVVAVGTQFEVRRDNNEMRVLVLEGTVRIEHAGIFSKTPQTRLAAGSAARTAKTAVLIDQPAAAQVEQLLSWRTGYLLFRDTALADAVADFNRYSTRKIVIEDAAIAGIRIGGHFRCDDADAFLWLLQSGFPINVEKRSDRIILTKR